jgi:hypothetical protein
LAIIGDRSPFFLLWRAQCIGIGTEDTTEAFFGFHSEQTAWTFPSDLAEIKGHLYLLDMAALRTSDLGGGLNLGHIVAYMIKCKKTFVF